MTAQVHSFQRAASGCPEPLVPRGINIRAVEGTMLDNYDMLDSDWISRLDLAERGAAMTLHMVSMRQQPSGSLPDDDVLLAGYLGFSVRETDLWLAMRAKVMNGWVLCSDGRLYHPYRAKNVLRLWIGWRETNRRSALGNGVRSAEVRRGVREIEADIDLAAGALRALDPKDKFLDDLDVRMSKWTTRPHLVAEGPPAAAAVTPSEPTVTAAVTPGTPPLDGSQRLGQAKPSQNPSSGLRPEDSCQAQREEREVVEGEVLPPLAGVVVRMREPPQAWPPDWFARFRALYPKKKSWGAAEKALERVRKAGKVPFATVMAGIEQLVAEGKDPKYIPHASTWVNARGWEDEPDSPAGSRAARPGGRPTSALQSAAYGMILSSTPRSSTT